MTIEEVHQQGTLEQYYLKMAIHEEVPKLQEKEGQA
jgi:hypothetical protein